MAARDELLRPNLSRYYGFPAPGGDVQQRTSSPVFHGFDPQSAGPPRQHGLPDIENSSEGSRYEQGPQQRLAVPSSDESSFQGFNPNDAQEAQRTARVTAQALD